MQQIPRKDSCPVRECTLILWYEANAKISSDGSVLDLPQLYIRPPAVELLSTLHHLQLKPLTWDDVEESRPKVSDEAGLPAYLTSIIASRLAWIADDSVKEQIWEAASARLSERSGRSGMLGELMCCEREALTWEQQSLPCPVHLLCRLLRLRNPSPSSSTNLP